MNKGDHVRVYRGGYYHHGISMDSSTVMHFTGEPTRKSQSSKIKRTSFEDFLEGGKLEIVTYPNYQILPVDQTLLIAWDYENGDGYKLFKNNCEHFSVRCKTGKGYSYQIQAVVQEASDWSRKLSFMALRYSAKSSIAPIAAIGAFVLGGVAVVGIKKIIENGIFRLKTAIIGNPSQFTCIGSQYMDANGYNYFYKNSTHYTGFTEGWYIFDPAQYFWISIEKSPPLDLYCYAYFYKNSANTIFMKNSEGFFILSE